MMLGRSSVTFLSKRKYGNKKNASFYAKYSEKDITTALCLPKEHITITTLTPNYIPNIPKYP